MYDPLNTAGGAGPLGDIFVHPDGSSTTVLHANEASRYAYLNYASQFAVKDPMRSGGFLFDPGAIKAANATIGAQQLPVSQQYGLNAVAARPIPGLNAPFESIPPLPHPDASNSLTPGQYGGDDALVGRGVNALTAPPTTESSPLGGLFLIGGIVLLAVLFARK